MGTETAALIVPRAAEHAKPLSTTFVSSLLRLSDLSIVFIAGVAVHLYYVYSKEAEFSSQYLGTISIGVLTAAALFQWLGVYSGDYVFSKRLRIDRVLSAWAITGCVLLALAFALKVSEYYSRVWAVGWFVTTGGTMIIVRLALSQWISAGARQGRFAARTVIVGAGEQGQRLAAHLNRHGDLRIRVIGLIDDRKTRVPMQSQGYEVLGDVEQLIYLIRRDMVDQIIIALPWSAEHRLRELVKQLATTPVRICLAPDLVGFEFAGRSFTQVAQLPMLHVFDRPISGWSFVTKTIEDWVVASLLLLLLGPLLLLISLVIKLDSAGPVFFKQKRQGFNNNLIEVWKFRTMHTDMEDADCDVQTVKDDPRVTRVGRFLRKSSLDELPQLLNVLRGDMSIVGPRPHALATKAEGQLFEEVVDSYAARHRVKPGITGWAQVNGWRGETDTIRKIQKRVEHDLYYIENWSVWLDLYIMLKTVAVLLKDDNAY